jgi:hypothetical protein
VEFDKVIALEDGMIKEKKDKEEDEEIGIILTWIPH